MRLGDLVKYNTFLSKGEVTGSAIGIIIKILSRDERDDNILVQWNTGQVWCVCEHWIDIVE